MTPSLWQSQCLDLYVPVYSWCTQVVLRAKWQGVTFIPLDTAILDGALIS